MAASSGDISHLLGKDSQRLNFVLFFNNERYVLRVGYIDGPEKQTHQQIALDYLAQTDRETSAFQLNSNPINAGVRGGGVVEWYPLGSQENTPKIIFHCGSRYGNPTKEEITALMRDKALYSWEYHPQNREPAYSFW